MNTGRIIVQLVGFLILIAGNLVYNNLIKFDWLQANEEGIFFAIKVILLYYKRGMMKTSQLMVDLFIDCKLSVLFTVELFIFCIFSKFNKEVYKLSKIYKL